MADQKDTLDVKFQEELGGFFYDAMKAAGMTMFPGNFPERVRDIGTRMAKSVNAAATRRSVAVIKELQERVHTAFISFEKELDDLKKLVLLQQEQITVLRAALDDEPQAPVPPKPKSNKPL